MKLSNDFLLFVQFLGWALSWESSVLHFAGYSRSGQLEATSSTLCSDNIRGIQHFVWDLSESWTPSRRGRRRRRASPGWRRSSTTPPSSSAPSPSAASSPSCSSYPSHWTPPSQQCEQESTSHYLNSLSFIYLNCYLRMHMFVEFPVHCKVTSYEMRYGKTNCSWSSCR